MQNQLFLIHWHTEEVQHIAAQLQTVGWNIIGFEAQDGGKAYKQIKKLNPEVVIIFLTRQPSHGRQTAKALNQTKATHTIPLIFVGGSDKTVDETRRPFPEATFTTPENLLTVLANKVDLAQTSVA